MKLSVKIGSVGRIPIELHVTFILLMAFVFYISYISPGPGQYYFFLLLVLLFVFVTLHELSHSVVARHYNVTVRKIVLYPIGGVSNFPILPNGISDLFLQIIDTGIIDDAGNFIHATSTGEGQQTGIVFDVWNFGTAVSGPWRLLAELPTFAGNFTSEPQKSLAPGEKIRFTIGFRLLTNPGPNNVTIIIDPQNELNELNRVNNIVSATVIRNY